MAENGGGFGFGDYEEGSGGSADSSAEAAAMTKSHLPLNSDATATATAASADTLFLGPSPSSSGGMMGNSRAAFTLAQRDELERQTLIFKCMVASTPVPPQLLLPLKSKAIIGSTRILCSSSSDPEPWRCRRTDGKKWRCSRDVAPHQKYCERHSHKNRPRSRKPVELLSNSTSNKTHMQLRDSNFFSPPASGQGSVSLLVPYHGQKDFLHAMDSATPRSLEWFMKGEVIAVPNSEQLERQHQHGFMSPYEPDQELQGHGRGLVNDECNLLLRMTPLERDNCSEGSASLSKRMPTPSLSLATFGGGEVGGGGEHDERKSFGHVGLGIRHHNVTNGWEGDRRAESKPHCMSPGGPLAEALCLGTPNIGKSPPCDRAWGSS